MLTTAEWTDDDLNTADEFCTELGGHLLDFLSVSYAESGCHPWALNDNPKTTSDLEQRYNAAGLIQMMPFILKNLGFMPAAGPRARAEAFTKLHVGDQLPYVRRYFLPHKGKLTNRVAWYMATFLPAYLAHADEPDFVLATKGAPGFSGAVYTANAGFDADGDKKIVVNELDLAIARNCVGPRWAEFEARALGQTTVPPPGKADLTTWAGAQTALGALGFYEGKADGFWGPLSRMATIEFQAVHPPLVADGVYGSRTRAALQAEYNAWLAAPLAALPLQ